MILSVPGPDGPVQQNVPDAVLAERFWASSWGLRARLEHADPSIALITYLTAGRHLGGLQATWGGDTGLHHLRDMITGVNGAGRDQETA